MKGDTGTKLTGRLATGLGEGSFFTGLEWARAQFRDKLDIDPYPGTLNIHPDDARQLNIWHSVSAGDGIRIDNPGSGPKDCDARCYPVLINEQIPGAIVLPEVPGYPAGKIEVIAESCVREVLDVEDGDRLTLQIRVVNRSGPKRP